MHLMEMLVKAWISLGKERCCQQDMEMLDGIRRMDESLWLQQRQLIKQKIDEFMNIFDQY